MRRIPDLESLIGDGLGRDERERLQRIHELLIVAGPPPDLSPGMEARRPPFVPRPGRGRRQPKRRVMALGAAAVGTLVLAFLGGSLAGNGGGSERASGQLLRLAGTPEAPFASASLRIEPPDSAGNRPMRLSATGLPKLPASEQYEVYLVRNGKLYACGSFAVATPAQRVSVLLSAPYRLKPGDSWVVARELNHGARREQQAIIMRPVT